MKNFALILAAFVLFSCGNSSKQSNVIESNAIEEETVSEATPISTENSGFGKVTEVHPEENIRFKKIILSDPYEFKERYDNGSPVIDVRSTEEFAQGHIAGAINIPLSDAEFATKAKALMNNMPILVYSQQGIKSKEATHVLEKIGFQKIYNLDGGYIAWKKTGL